MLGAAALAGGLTGGILIVLTGISGVIKGDSFRAAARDAFGIGTLAGLTAFGATVAATSALSACPRTKSRALAGRR